MVNFEDSKHKKMELFSIEIKLKKLSKINIISFLIIFSLMSCKQKEKEATTDDFQDKKITDEFKEISTGEEYSIIVISDLATKYPDLKTALNNLFAIKFDVLPQNEPHFNPIIIHPDSLTEDQKLNLCIMALNVNSASDRMNAFAENELHIDKNVNNESRFQISENTWAYPQKVIYAEASTIEELILLLEKKQNDFIEEYDQSEKIRLKRRVYAKGRNNTATTRLLKMHQIDISIPKGYVNIMERVPSKSDTILRNLKIDGLSWFRNNTKAYNMDILFYYTSLDQFKDDEIDKILLKKDQITSNLIQGQNQGSYVVIAYDYNPPVIRDVTISGYEAIEIRGLWETEGDFMGGPFLYYAIKDLKNNRMLFIDAIVYAPEIKKKPFIKRLEVTLQTLR